MSPATSQLEANFEQLWRAEQVAAYLQITKSAVYKLAARGELPCRRFGGQTVRFVPAEVRAWVAAQRPQHANVISLRGDR